MMTGNTMKTAIIHSAFLNPVFQGTQCEILFSQSEQVLTVPETKYRACHTVQTAPELPGRTTGSHTLALCYQNTGNLRFNNEYAISSITLKSRNNRLFTAKKVLPTHLKNEP